MEAEINTVGTQSSLIILQWIIVAVVVTALVFIIRRAWRHKTGRALVIIFGTLILVTLAIGYWLLGEYAKGMSL